MYPIRLIILSLLISLTWLVGCQTTPPPPATVVVVSTAPPTAPPTPWPTVNPTATPTPPTLGQWQCDPLGGLACFDDLTTLDMLNAEQGWMVSDSGHLFRYSRTSESDIPIWHRVPALGSPPDVDNFRFHQISVVGPDEWWGVANFYTTYYKAGQLDIILPPGGAAQLLGIDMLNVEKGWAVGTDGVLLRYFGDDWGVWTTPGESKESLVSIATISADEAWLIGHNIFAHYKDGIWEKIDPPTHHDLYDIDMVDAQTGWAVGFTILHYQDGIWQEVTNDLVVPHDQLNAVSAVSTDEAWAVGDKGLMMHYHNGAWQRIASLTDYDLLDIKLVSSSEGWAVGRQSTLLHLQAGEWQVRSEAFPLWTGGLTDLAWIDETNEAWGVGDTEHMMHYQDGDWKMISNPSGEALIAIDMVDSGVGWAVGLNGTMLRYTPIGWQMEPRVTTQHIWAIAMLTEQYGWAVGQGTILNYQDGVWSESFTLLNGSQVLNDVATVNPTEAWAVGQQGIMLHYQNGVWLEVTDVTDKNLNEVTMLDAENGWAVGNDVVLRYQAGRWYAVEHPEGVKFLSMHLFSAEEGWFLSRTGAWYYHHGQWQPVTLPANNGVKLVMANEHEGWIVGGGILHYTDAP